MKDEIRSKQLNIRMTEEEHALIQESAKANGFHTITQFLLWLVRKYGKKQD